jgi:hypothetical protein
VAQAIGDLLCKHKVLSSSPHPPKKNSKMNLYLIFGSHWTSFGPAKKVSLSVESQCIISLLEKRVEALGFVHLKSEIQVWLKCL